MKQGFLVSGEASSELYAARLAGALREHVPGISFAGIGGERMRAEGVELLFSYSDLSVVGALEIFSHWKKVRQAMKACVKWIKEHKPDFVILFDFPDFNFMLIRSIRKWYRGKILYFISPQIWAWRQKRKFFLKKNVDHMIVILPFEKKIYEEIGFSVEYLGHPLVDIAKPCQAVKQFREDNGFMQNSRIIGIFPGSRKKEIEHHHGILGQFIDRMKTDYHDVEFCIAAANDELVPLLESKFRKSRVRVVANASHDVINASALVIAKSGTTTLEVAIGEKPAVVFYKVEPLSYRIGKLLINVKYIALPNLILDEMIYPEFIQDEFTAANLYSASRRFLDDTDLYITTVEKLTALKGMLGDEGYFRRAALTIKGWLDV